MSNKSQETSELTAANLKAALWETLKEVRSGAKQPAEADAIATQAREILRTVKVQLAVVAQSKRTVPVEVIAFAEK